MLSFSRFQVCCFHEEFVMIMVENNPKVFTMTLARLVISIQHQHLRNGYQYELKYILQQIQAKCYCFHF